MYNGLCRFATISRLFAMLALGPAAACGGDPGGNGGPGPNPQNETIQAADPSGDFQAGNPGQQLPEPLRVQIRRGATPVSGRTVTWQPAAGQVSPTSSVTGSDGIATTRITLPGGGQMTVTANASGTSGGPVGFTALVVGQRPTVAVTNNRFEPAAVAIRAGDEVVFDWPPAAIQHNIIPDDGKAIPSDPVVRDGAFQLVVRFPTPGVYFYHCNVHGSTRSGMFGRVIVVP